MSVLEMRSISKVYGRGAAEVQALRDISLTVPAGTMVAAMGPTGSGKSSLLTIAGTLEEPTSGAVLINGQDVERMSNAAMARVRRHTIGYVFESKSGQLGLGQISEGATVGGILLALGVLAMTVGLIRRRPATCARSPRRGRAGAPGGRSPASPRA